MKGKRRKWIEDVASRAREIAGLSTDDIIGDLESLEKIVEGFGGAIEYFSMYESYEEVVKSGDEEFTIRIDSSNTETFQRFSIARELGHLFLHMRYRTKKWDEIGIGANYSRMKGAFTIFEEDASDFATAFLMPEEAFIKIANETSDDNHYYPDKIAKHFKVSEECTNLRGRNLALWEQIKN